MNNTKVKSILNLIHDACNANGMIRARCLGTSLIAKEVFQALGVEVAMFPCSVIAMSEKLAKKLDGLNRHPTKAEGELWASQGARMVAIYANERPEAAKGLEVERPLYGHMCLMIKYQGRALFLDPTAYQFKRSKREHGFVIDAPVAIVCETGVAMYRDVFEHNLLPFEDSQTVVPSGLTVGLKGGGQIQYEYCQLEQLSNPTQALIASTDLDVSKYQHIIDYVLEKATL